MANSKESRLLIIDTAGIVLDTDETIELLKESCKIAVDGLDCIEYNPPINVFLLILSVILAVILVGMGLFQLLAYFNFFQ